MHVGHFVMAFKKIMRPNNSAFPNKHESALDALVMLNSSFIPELYSYNDVEYECESIDGESLEDYILRTGDFNRGLEIHQQLNTFMHKMAEIEHDGLRLSADDIHSKNIIVTEKNAYIVDLDQFGWYHPFVIFKLLQTMNGRICDTVKTSLLMHESKHMFESGVRHGFWNVKTKEEIKEKYEKYKHLEAWYVANS